MVHTPAATLLRPAFSDRVRAAIQIHGPLVFGLDPSSDLLVEWGCGDTPDGLDRFVDVVVDAAQGSVGIVKPQSAFYERFGWRGVRSLARLVDACRDVGLVVILDAKRGDVGSTNDAYAAAYFGPEAGIPVDALTVTPYLGLAAMRPILDRAVEMAGGVFIVARSSNPEGRSIQLARHDDGGSIEATLLEQIAVENHRVGPDGEPGPIGAVFGPTHGAPDFDLRRMDGWFLAPGVGAQGATPAAVAACFAACPDRVLPSASRTLLSAGPDRLRLRGGLLAFGDAIGTALQTH